MFLKEIEIHHFRNFNDTTVKFKDGVNIIVGPNNSGKSNLLYAINKLDSIDKSAGTIHDFNKNDISKNLEGYKINPPVIKIKYSIEHSLKLDSFDDGILRIKNFIVYTEDGKAISDADGNYTINAEVELRYELDPKYLQEYKTLMSNINNIKEYMQAMEKIISNFAWTYYNTTSEKPIGKNEINRIFSIDLIKADRQTETTLPQTRKYIKEKIVEKDCSVDLRHSVTDIINTNLEDILKSISVTITEDEDAIGITNGNNKVIPKFEYNSSFEQYFEFSLMDSKMEYDLPMNNNGLGYNNLIQIFGVIKFRINQDYNLLLIEEPESHLHPAMQYKLFQYLKKLKQDIGDENIKNQIFVTTHSPNITASADLNDMISLYYKRNEDEHKVVACNLQDIFGKAEFAEAKNHLSKFLDVTRCDLLFTQKTILVEGLAEKLLMGAFAKKGDINYDLEFNHVSVVEVGGVNHNHFLPLFLLNQNKVLCYRDCDYDYYDMENNIIKVNDIEQYNTHLSEINFLDDCFNDIDNIKMFTQKNYGSTFENELFIDNYGDKGIIKSLFSMISPEKVNAFIEKYGFDIEKWKENIDLLGDRRSEKKINKLLPVYYLKYESYDEPEKKKHIEKVFFANLFLAYVKGLKGDFALNLLESELIENIKVPEYIKDGLTWLQE
ncbi:MAG: AAA family ATPase [Eubacteriales bacterium]